MWVGLSICVYVLITLCRRGGLVWQRDRELPTVMDSSRSLLKVKQTSVGPLEPCGYSLFWTTWLHLQILIQTICWRVQEHAFLQAPQKYGPYLKNLGFRKHPKID